MKKFISASVVIFFSILLNGCDPFEEYFINLKMDQQFQLYGIGPNIEQQIEFCLSNYDDYNDNANKIEQIKYLDAAYLSLNASEGLRGDNLSLKMYESDGTTLLFDFNLPSFVADEYANKPLHIELTQSEKDKINQYIQDHQKNNCFVAKLTVENVNSNNTLPYFSLQAKIEFVAELKLKP